MGHFLAALPCHNISFSSHTWVPPFQCRGWHTDHSYTSMHLDFLLMELSMLVDARTLWYKDLGTIFRGILSHASFQESVSSLSVNFEMSTITIWHLVFYTFVCEPRISLASQLLFRHCARKLAKEIFRLFLASSNNIQICILLLFFFFFFWYF